jgi:hypothetical protein
MIIFFQPAVKEISQYPAENRCYPENSKMVDGSTDGGRGHRGSAGRLDRRWDDRDAAQVDQVQAEANCDGRESLGYPVIGCSIKEQQVIKASYQAYLCF